MGLFNKLFGKKKEEQAPPAARLRPDYNLYFEKDAVGGIAIERQYIGDLYMPSGAIIGCDPLVGLTDTLAFTRTVAPGRYPVIACVANTVKSGDRYAAVKLAFTEVPSVKWELAVIPGQQVEYLKDDEYFGIQVDAGLACFCDAATRDLYNQWQDAHFEENPEGDMYTDFFEDALKGNGKNPADPYDVGDWLDFHLPSGADYNIIMFNSGYGDGMYPCYWGLAADGSISCLVVDFLVL